MPLLKQSTPGAERESRGERRVAEEDKRTGADKKRLANTNILKHK